MEKINQCKWRLKLPQSNAKWHLTVGEWRGTLHKASVNLSLSFFVSYSSAGCMHVLFQNIASILNSKKIITLKYYVCKTITLTSHVLHSDCISASTTFVLPSHTSGFIFLPCRNTNCLYSISCFVFPSRHFFIPFFSFCMNSIDNCFNCLPAFISEGDDMF